MTRYPSHVSLREMPRPSPRLPPVTMTLRMAACHLAGCRKDQRADKVDRRRDLVPSKHLTAKLHDLALDLARGPARQIRFCFQDYVGDDDPTRNGVLSGSD